MAVNYLLLHVLTAVDGDVGAGDEDCLIRAEVDDEARDLLRLSQAAERDLRENLRRARPSGDCVDGDPFAPRQRFGEAVTIVIHSMTPRSGFLETFPLSA